MSDVVQQLRRHRMWLFVGYDGCAWVLAYCLVAWLRFDSVASHVPWREIVVFGLANACCIS